MDIFITILLTSGSVLLLMSLLPIRRILDLSRDGNVKSYWRLLFVLVCLFLCGYLAYGWFFWGQYSSLVDLIVPVIFFFGAVFVLLVCTLSLTTAEELRRTFQLERDSITDSLLNIYNRGYLERRLSEELSSARRYGHELSLLMIDVDRFKGINDRWGHQVGDEVLQDVVSLIKNRIRETDTFCRYGGEELVLILPHTGSGAAIAKAEQIREMIEQSSIHCQLVTVSIGVASLSDQITTAKELIWQADMAMYRAKKGGRNRCEFFAVPQDPQKDAQG